MNLAGINSIRIYESDVKGRHKYATRKSQVLDEKSKIIEEQVYILNWKKIYEDDTLY